MRQSDRHGFRPLKAQHPPSTAPCVTVIIPAYNAATTIAESLLSVRRQTLENIEIIVVNDGSTDRTIEIVRAAQAVDDRVHLVAQTNQGVAIARNTGVAKAHAPYIALLDADDLWHPRKLELQLNALAASGPNTALAYSFSDTIDETGRILWASNRIAYEGDCLAILMGHDFIGNGSNALIRREAYLAVGGSDPSLNRAGAQGGEDWLLALRIAEKYKFVCEPQVLVGYRRMAGNMSGNAARMVRSAKIVFEEFAASHPGYMTELSQCLKDRELWALARLLAEGQFAQLPEFVGEVGSYGRFVALLPRALYHALRERLGRISRTIRRLLKNAFGWRVF